MFGSDVIVRSIFGSDVKLVMCVCVCCISSVLYLSSVMFKILNVLTCLF